MNGNFSTGLASSHQTATFQKEGYFGKNEIFPGWSSNPIEV